MSERHRHTAFGLTFASDMPIPELPFAAAGATADIDIRLGEVSPDLAGSQVIEAGVSARPGALLIDFETARFLVTDGRQIQIQPGPQAADKEVRAYLLGSAMGALMHQRGLLPLHANAVEIDGRAIAFAGASGAGKSTLAAWFRTRGHRLLCDDVCAVSFDRDGAALAWPGVPRIKLWRDALSVFGHGADTLEQVVNWEDKFSLPLTHDAIPAPLPLARIYVLKECEGEGRVVSLTGAAAFDAVSSNVYRSEFAGPLGQAQTLFAGILALVRSAELFIAERRLGFDVFQAEAGRLERHVADTLSNHGSGARVAGRFP